MKRHERRVGLVYQLLNGGNLGLNGVPNQGGMHMQQNRGMLGPVKHLVNPNPRADL